MKQIDTMPTDGQFVAVYKANDAIWSNTLLWSEGKISYYNEQEDEFEGVDYDVVEHLSKRKAIFFVL